MIHYAFFYFEAFILFIFPDTFSMATLFNFLGSFFLCNFSLIEISFFIGKYHNFVVWRQIVNVLKNTIMELESMHLFCYQTQHWKKKNHKKTWVGKSNLFEKFGFSQTFIFTQHVIRQSDWKTHFNTGGVANYTYLSKKKNVMCLIIYTCTRN